MNRVQRLPWKQWLLGYPGASVLLAIYWIVAVTATVEKSTTCDEIAHLTSGYSYWLLNDYRLQPENGNLPQRFGALPLLFSRPTFPNTDSKAWQQSDVWQIGFDFFYHSGNDPDRMLLQARAAMAFWGVAVGLLVFAWSRSLFGPVGGMLSLIVCLSCPTMLAHGPFVTSDMTAAFFFLAAAGAWWRLLQHLSPARFFWCFLALAGLFLAKFSAMLLVPMGLLLLGVRLLKGIPLSWRFGKRGGAIQQRGIQLGVLISLGLGQILLVGLALWAAYGFRYRAFADDTEAAVLYPFGWDFFLTGLGTLGKLVGKMRDWKLLPESYLFGFAHTVHQAQSRSAFLNGARGETGWIQFFPYAFLVKTPIPSLLLLAGAAAAIWRKSKSRPQEASVGKWLRGSLYTAAPLWILIAVYAEAAVTSNLNIGHRHILPIYPALFVLTGAAGYWFEMRVLEPTGSRRSWLPGFRATHPLGLVLMASALVLLVSESVIIYPHYLAYFNQFVGGPPYGYRHLVDSSLDWGQDLPGLKRWIETNAAAKEPVYVSYFGSASVAYYLPDVPVKILPCFGTSRIDCPPERATETDPAPLRPGIYCISATMLQGVYSPPIIHAPWTSEHEEFFRKLTQKVKAYETAKGGPNSRIVSENEKDNWPNILWNYDQIRFERLCTYLRRREPDAYVGYSILIFRLDQEELDRALLSPLIPD